MKRNESRTRIEETDGNFAKVRYYRYTGRAFEPMVFTTFWIEMGAKLVWCGVKVDRGIGEHKGKETSNGNKALHHRAGSI